MKILVINSSYVNFVGTLFSIALDKYFDEVKCFNLPNKIYYDFDILEGKIETYYNKYNIEEKDLFNYDFDVILALQTSGLYTAIPIYNAMKKIGKKCLIGMQILDYPQHVFQHNKDYIKDVYDSWQFYLSVLKEFKFDFLLYNMYNAKDALSSYTILTKVQNFIKYPILSHITELPQEDFIVYSGRIVPDKGVQYIIEALSLLNKPIKFITIGSGYDFSSYADFLKVNYVNIQNCPESEKWEFYQKSRFLVCGADNPYIPSLGIIEGLSIGRSGIVFDTPENRKHYRDYVFYIPNRNINELSNLINTLWNNPYMANDLGNMGIEYCKKECSYDNWAKVVYNTIIECGE